MNRTVRPLTSDDAEQSRRLGWEAFGMPDPRPEAPAVLDRPGKAWWGVFEGDALLARAVDRDETSCFGGALLPTSGVAGVTVAAEVRGRGLLGPLMAALLAGARERGAVLTTLFPSAPGIYRRLGYEVVAQYDTVEVPTAELAAVPPSAGGTRARRGTEADLPAVRAVYDTWARAQNGPLTRRGVGYPETDAELLDETDALTVAEDPDGRVVGYARWDRGQGYGESATISCDELLALSEDGLRVLLRTLGSFASICGRVELDTTAPDPARLLLPATAWRVVGSRPYMLRLLDVLAAFAPLHYPAGLTASLAFTVAGDAVGGTDGGYRLEVADGRGHCEPTAPDPTARVLSPRGLAQLYAGAQSCANLRSSGALSGGDVGQDSTWDVLHGGRRVHIRDAF